MKKCKLSNIHDDEYLLALYANILFSTWAPGYINARVFIKTIVFYLAND